MEWPQLTLEDNQLNLLQGPVELTSSPDSTANDEVWMSHQSRKRLPPHQGIVQRRRRRRQCLFRKFFEYTDGNEAQVYILIDIHGQYFILNTDSSDCMSSNFSLEAPFTTDNEQEKHYPHTVRKTYKDYQVSSKKRRGRRETLFRKSVEYSDKCSADVYVIIYVNNRYITLYTNEIRHHRWSKLRITTPSRFTRRLIIIDNRLDDGLQLFAVQKEKMPILEDFMTDTPIPSFRTNLLTFSLLIK
ncbi:hypothetical protein I7I51_03030 [Histoplasma capsulatum]|uniref:MADS-box domain-containing protein n=1 Tax=Ajellomyces capsulatus TaxID=5037 RepID=A0A8A1MJQ1_AJECA|nr:hypothetical protein I7I51_03030 [Histoplasma capsulatum]